MVPEALAAALATLREAADDPDGYVVAWKRRTGGKVVGAFPMNFPAEIAHAAGTLPVLIQENRDRTRRAASCSPSSTAATRATSPTRRPRAGSSIYDGLFLADHCVQLLGAADVVR